MSHLDFIVWMILYPIMLSLCELLTAKARGSTYKHEVTFISSLIIVGTYVYVAIQLY